MRLLIVDDEELTRSGLISSIPWAGLGIDAVFQAGDGIRGLQAAKEIRPEIILCDVRMPCLDGIKMARKILHMLPDSAIIFMSGYSDKEYLKAAIRLRAVRYVEKPLNSEEVCEAVLEAAGYCRKRQKELQSERYLQAEQARELALLLTLPYHKNSESILKLWSALQCPPALQTAVTTVLVTFSSHDVFTNGTIHTLPDSINNYLKSYRLFALVAHRYHNCLVIHICGCRKLPPRDRREIFAFLEQLFLPYRDYYITCGRNAAGLPAVYKSYETSVILMESSFFFKPNTVLTPELCSGCVSKSGSAHVPAGPEQNIPAALLSSDKDTAIRCLNDIYRFYRRNTAVLSDHAKETYYRLFLSLEDCRTRLKITAGSGQAANGKTVMRYLDEFFSLDSLHQAMLSQIHKFFNDLQDQTEENTTIYLIKRYIRDSYANETLSVKDISEHVHLNASYLCTIFKAETGQTLNQYITRCRMERAKKLLPDPRYKISEISSMVGYSDGNYFGKSFKKAVGMSPSEYREKWVL